MSFDNTTPSFRPKTSWKVKISPIILPFSTIKQFTLISQNLTIFSASLNHTLMRIQNRSFVKIPQLKKYFVTIQNKFQNKTNQVIFHTSWMKQLNKNVKILENYYVVKFLFILFSEIFESEHHVNWIFWRWIARLKKMVKMENKLIDWKLNFFGHRVLCNVLFFFFWILNFRFMLKRKVVSCVWHPDSHFSEINKYREETIK